jgi:hypothetical protein
MSFQILLPNAYRILAAGQGVAFRPALPARTYRQGSQRRSRPRRCRWCRLRYEDTLDCRRKSGFGSWCISVYYARGSDGLRAVRAGSSIDEGIILAGGRNVISPREGTFSVMSVEDVAVLKPSVIILADPKAVEQGSPLRKALPIETLFLVDRGLPYGWIERPPSLNRLIGALWLASRLYPGEISFPVDDPHNERRSVSSGPDGSNDQRNVLLTPLQRHRLPVLSKHDNMDVLKCVKKRV